MPAVRKRHWIIILAALIVVMVGALKFRTGPAKAPEPTARSTNAVAPLAEKRAPVRLYAPRPANPPPETATEEDAPATRLGLSHDSVEAWLAQRPRNATNLLAALHATGDTNYLMEAALNFPDDPRLQYAVLTRDAFPEDRRKWLEAFKASSPSNSLANYFSAIEYFKSGQSDSALVDLQAATGKSEFNDYALSSRSICEELCLAAGKSPLEAATIALTGYSEELIPQLSSMKQLTRGITELPKQTSAAGSADSGDNAMRMGLILADQLRTGDGGKTMISQMVGNACEAIFLQQLDPNTSYPFLDNKTPAQRLEELKLSRQEFRQMTVDFEPIFAEMSETERLVYLQREKIYGEVETRRWLLQKNREK